MNASKSGAVGSLLGGGTTAEVLNADRKEFDDDGVKVTIAQIEELGLQALEGRREELMEALQRLALDEGFDLAVLAVTDIAKHYSVVLAAGDRRLVANLPFEEVAPGCYNAPGVVSRKKQLFPGVCHAIRRLA